MSGAQSTRTAVEQETARVPCLIPAGRLADRVSELARAISRDHGEEPLLVVGILQGAYVFMADLVRHLAMPVRCAFVMLSSYGNETETSGRVDLRLDLSESIEGKHVLLVDDIVDTGTSLSWLVDHLKERRPASLQVCALLNKAARRRVDVQVDYIGFEVPDRFVVGYGIDYAGRYRELPYVGYVDVDQSS
jgi:hypoxanthine phosphoribosyltransferase